MNQLQCLIIPPLNPLKKEDKNIKSFHKTKPEVKESTSQKINSPIFEKDFSFDNVKSKWKSFLEIIKKEKGLTLAPALLNFNLDSLKNNELSMSSDNEEDINTFRINEKYLSKKSEDFFGHRFNFIVNSSETKISKTKTSVKKSVLPDETSSSSYEDIILNELGGEKIA
ncbi:MAG: hypothetical protein P8X47_00950 [Ignavibacteriaceae bacterium]